MQQHRAAAEGRVPGRTIPEVLAQAAALHGPREAIVDGDRRLTYAALAEVARDAARAFLAHGVEAGDRVALWAPNSGAWIVAALGLQSVGAVLVPINTRFKGAEAHDLLARSRARMLFTVNGFLGVEYVAALRTACSDAASGRRPDAAPDARRKVATLPGLEHVVVLEGPVPDGCLAWREFLDAGREVPPVEAERRAAAVREDDLCDILFTSGTTGVPKGVQTTHRQALRAQRSWIDMVGLESGDRYLIVNPFFHAFGYRAGWLSCLLVGATILPEAVLEPGRLAGRVARERVTVLPGPPTLYQSLLALPASERPPCATLRLAVTGAASVPVELVRRMRSELGFATVITGYGLTECTGVATMCRSDDDLETIATTCGRAIPDVEVRVVGDDGRELPRGTEGEVVIRGYNVTCGYLDDEAATREAIDPDGFLHTGDVGVMDERGYLRITDRKKDLFIVGGFNVSPADVERALLRHPAIAHAAVIGVPDERLGEVGMAFVVPRPGERLARDEVVAWCRQEIANFKVPRHVAIVDDLPLNATGKVQKLVLRERARALLATRNG
ncbi:MAG: FadD3 family acyl-CoA ligase [Thermodesulfobacteriota bacterium]